LSIPFVIERVYEVPIEKVWQALTDTAAMKAWYFPQLGLESSPADPHFARHRFEDGWGQILDNNLKVYLERNG
jgi:hypothetical protein